MELKDALVLLLCIKGAAPSLPAHTWEPLQRLLQDAADPARSGPAGPELNSEHKCRYGKTEGKGVL